MRRSPRFARVDRRFESSTGQQGDAHSIWIDSKTGIAYGAADHRSPDSKASAPR